MCAAGGCEPAPRAPSQATPASSTAPSVAPVEPPPPERPPLVLTSLEQALDELIAAVDDRRSKDYQAAAAYLQERGPEAIEPIVSRLGGEGLSPQAEIALVRQLGAAGEPALSELERLADGSQKDVVRLTAIEQIGSVRPVTPRATDFLRRILKEEVGEPRDRIRALESLDRQGVNSSEFADDLRRIMDSDAPEALRIQAKKSLDRAAPRRTFEDRD